MVKDRKAWHAAVLRVTRTRTRLSNWTTAASEGLSNINTILLLAWRLLRPLPDGAGRLPQAPPRTCRLSWALCVHPRPSALHWVLTSAGLASAWLWFMGNSMQSFCRTWEGARKVRFLFPDLLPPRVTLSRMWPCPKITRFVLKGTVFLPRFR